MLQRLQKPPFTDQVNHSDEMLRLTLNAQDSGESPDETAAQYEWAIRKNPGDRVLHYNYGLFLFDHNRAAAAQQLSLSRPWDGFPVFTPDGTPVE
jgi:Tfp pilus assembly protein PilF